MAGVALVLGVPGLASAHQIGHDNGVSVILHVEPADTPVAGVPTELRLYYGSVSAGTTFNTTFCTCRVMVTADNKTIVDEPITAEFGSGTEATAMVTFPKLAVYSVIVSGKATNGQFGTFSVPFVVRVDVAAASGNRGDQTVEVMIVALVAFGAMGAVIWQIRGPRRRRSVKI